MVNAFRKLGEHLWHKTRSPPEAVNSNFDLKAIPSFYFFNKNGDFISRIIEHPKATNEEDTLEILKENL